MDSNINFRRKFIWLQKQMVDFIYSNFSYRWDQVKKRDLW